MDWRKNIGETGQALIRQARKRRARLLLAILGVVGVSGVTALGALAADFCVFAATDGKDGVIRHFSVPLLSWAFISALFVIRLLWRISGARRQISRRLERLANLTTLGEDARVDWLLAEIGRQCVGMGLSHKPDVFLFEQGNFGEFTAFSHIALIDNGRVAIPYDWLYSSHDDDAIKGLIAHELAHIVNRDGLVREIAETSSEIFVWLPVHLISGYLLFIACVSIPIFIVATTLSVILSLVVNSPIQLLNIGKLIWAMSTTPLVLDSISAILFLAASGVFLKFYTGRLMKQQEYDADFAAAEISSPRSMKMMIDMLQLIEQSEPPSSPLSRQHLIAAARRKIMESSLFANVDDKTIQTALKIQARIAVSLLWILTRSRHFVRLYLWSLDYCGPHPPTYKRLERALKVYARGVIRGTIL